MMRSKENTWSAENEQMLAELYAQGQSYRQIGKQLACSRSAIAGKVKRLKLTQHLDSHEARLVIKEKAAPTPRPQRKPRVKPASKRVFSIGRGAPQREELPPQPVNRIGVFMPAFAPEAARMVSLVDLEKGQCKWPFEQGDKHVFCGRDAEKGASYCAHHQRISERGSGMATEVAA